jgi:hypothetical protein
MFGELKFLLPAQLNANCNAMPYDSLTTSVIKKDIYQFDNIIYEDYWMPDNAGTFYVTRILNLNRIMFRGQMFASAVNLSTKEEMYLYMPRTCALEEVSIEVGRVLFGSERIMQVRYGLVSNFVDNYSNFKVIRYMIRKKYGKMSRDDVDSIHSDGHMFKKLLAICLGYDKCELEDIIDFMYDYKNIKKHPERNKSAQVFANSKGGLYERVRSDYKEKRIFKSNLSSS